MGKENKHEPLRFGQVPVKNAPPRFVRKNGRGYEYGEIEINWEDRTKDKHIVLGKTPTIDEALAINHMAAIDTEAPIIRVSSPLYPRRSA